jgi:outer membrane lipoprotein-sorting protein
MKKIFVLSIISIVILTSCRPAKKIQTVVSTKDTSVTVPITSPKIDSVAIKKDILSRVNSNHIDFQYFSSKIKVDYTDAKGKTINATAFIRIQKDSVIWASLTGLLGIEGFRVLVKPDTVIIMDKLEKTIAYKSVSYLQEMIKLPVDFYTLQDLLLGNVIFFPDNIVSYRNSGNTLLALSVGDFFKHLITVDTTDNRILHSKLDDVQEMRNRTCDITLSDYDQQQGKLFSSNREITITEKARLEIKLDFKQVTFNQPQSFPFNIPKNYTVK